jgi:hypothetical protein
MTTDPWDRALRAALAPARELEPTEDELRLALAAAGGHAPRRRRRAPKLAIAAGAAVVLATGTYAVPPTRAAIDDVYSAISGWAGGDEGGAPGRPLAPGDDAPAWVRDSGGEKRLVAENGDKRLYAIYDHEGKVSVALDDSVGITSSVADWRRQLAEHKLVLLGPGGDIDAQARRALYGLTSRSVTRVELRYDTGAPSVQEGLDGGFVLLADARRSPRTIVAYDRAGAEVEHVDVSSLILRVCRDDRGCPPGPWDPPTLEG